MTRRFTSLLVAALALLVSATVLAESQQWQKSAPSKQFAVTSSRQVLKSAQQAQLLMLKARDAHLGTKTDINFVGQAVQNVQDNNVALAKLLQNNLEVAKAASAVGNNLPQVNVIRRGNTVLNLGNGAGSSAKAPRRAGEVVDDYGIITSPAEGTTTTYARSGMSTYYNSGGILQAEQEGNIEVVETEDGVVYFKDFLARVSVGTYVKGTREGNTITVPAGQVIHYWGDYNYGLYLTLATLNGTSYEVVEGDITLTVDGNVISLDGTGNPEEGGVFVAAFYTDDNSFSGYGDYSSVYTYDPDFVAPEPVVLPDGATVETWNMKGVQVGSSGNSAVERTAKVAIVGDELYLSGIFQNFPNSWVKGTISGTTVTFSALQYLGDYGSYYIYAVGSNGYNSSAELQDFTMTYDADNQRLTSDNSLLANAAEDRIYFLEAYEGITIQVAEFEEEAVATGDNVDELPYSNTLTTADEFAEFGVIDANGDGKTWSFASSTVRYAYSSANNGDDWLISPAILLEAGKVYHFAIDAKAQGSSYPERLEVKIATEAKASVLAEGQQVIAPTDVTSTTLTTFENEALTVEETGYYHFGVHAISDADKYYLTVANFLVEQGAEASAPAAVTDLTVTQVEGVLQAVIAFNAPTVALNGEALTSNIAKIEILRNGEAIKTFEDVAPGAALTYTDNDETLSVGIYTYQVITYAADGIGGKSDEVSLFLTAVLSVPYVADLTDQSVFATFTAIDNNADNKTWAWSSSNHAYYNYSSSSDADDYLVSMPIKFEAGKTYKVTVAARAATASYPERFEVVYGTVATAEGLSNVAIAATEVTNTTAEDYVGEFIAAEEGDYYVAIHAISDADQYQLRISSLSVEKGAEVTAPAAVEDLAAVAGAEGALEVNISFTAPAKAIDGNNLTSNLTKVEILRDEEVVNTIEDVVPGSEQNWKDTEVENAKTYNYQVVAYNASGAGQKSEKASVYVGIDVPGALDEIALTDQVNSILVNWEKVGTEGANGGYVDPAQVTYNVWNTAYNSYYGWVANEVIGTSDGESFTYEYNTDEGDQDFLYLAVQPVNEVGEGDLTFGGLLVGKPYELPFIEGFEGNSFHYYWDIENLNAYISSESSDGDGTALRILADEPGLAALWSGKIALAGAANPSLLFDVKSDYIEQLSVVGSTSGGNFVSLATVAVGREYATVKVPLSSIQDDRFSLIGFVANFTNGSDTNNNVYGDDVIIDNIRIVDLFENNLSVAIEAPATVNAGSVADVKVVVANEGEVAATGFTVKLTAGEDVLLEETVSEEVAPFGTIELSAKIVTTIFDDDADVALKAEVAYAAEQKPEDNVAEKVISVKASTASAPENLVAVNGDEGVVLTWNAPAIVSAQVTETFEDQSIFEPGSVGGITSAQHTGAFGDWTLYDGNGITTYGWNGVTVPGVGEVSAWVVFNPASVSESFASSFAPVSGEQVLISMCPVDNSSTPAADHWLISPLLTGDAQTISLYAREITTNYGPETFEILASSTDTQVENFTVVASLSSTSTTWTEFTADLPEGTKYFAIRHTATDIFGLLIDDITFTTTSASPVSFNIYVDREYFADTTEETATLANLPAGDYEFGVSAVYANGAESKPTVTTLTVVTSISQIASDSKPVDVYSLDGRLVSRQATTLKGLKGAYIVNDRVVIIK